MENLVITKKQDKGIQGIKELLCEKMWWLTNNCLYLLKL